MAQNNDVIPCALKEIGENVCQSLLQKVARTRNYRFGQAASCAVAFDTISGKDPEIVDLFLVQLGMKGSDEFNSRLRIDLRGSR